MRAKTVVRIGAQALLAGMLFLCGISASNAGSVNDLLLPGKVIQGHAKYESDCSNCHKQFDRAAQSQLCKNCHKEIARDITEGRGLHGRAKNKTQPCKECHTEHKGRNAKIVVLDTRNFKHEQETGFPLKGAHASSKIHCSDCHRPGKKYREAPTQCVACHRKDDKHKGKLGTNCQSCHVEKSWKSTHFDHSKTHFPLNGKHVGVKCDACHPANRFKNTPMQCNACHRKDDRHKGNFGQKCETCHVDRGWKEIIFDHDRQTKYPLLGKHRNVKCTSCHIGNLYRHHLNSRCVSCHRKDDKHKGNFGTKCESCHVERGWKIVKFDHDRKTRFPLLGKHRDTKCTSCHVGSLYREKLKTDCWSCHRKDDKHRGQEGKKCDSCHDARTWKHARFDHRFARFPLTGSHQLVACNKCHATPRFKNTPSDCWTCHKKKDAHKRRLGTDCIRCHNTRDWRDWDFDHNRTRFKLVGKHKEIACVDCHKVPSKSSLSIATSCVSCHDKDDRHDGAYGVRCERCHVGTSWRTLKAGVNGGKGPQ